MTRLARPLAVAAGLAGFVMLWEGYKLLGSATGGTWPGLSAELPVATDDLTMPHTWDIVASLFEPVQRGRDETLAVGEGSIRLRPLDFGQKMVHQ